MLLLNSLPIPGASSDSASQTYEEFGGFSLLRLGEGAAVAQETWRRRRTTISASGWEPPGLDGFDWSAPVVVGCIAARAIQSASAVIAIPAARRSDAGAEPYGFAITAEGVLVPTELSMGGDTATLTTVAGAVGYLARWYPVMTVIAQAGPVVRTDADQKVVGWDLIGEEL